MNISSKKCESETSDPRPGITINSRFFIPQTELVVRATRSSGAGGQHVNKVSSRIELLWNIETSSVPTDAERARLREALASRLNALGELRIVASDTRSQFRNRDIAEARLAALVKQALTVPKVRRPTRPSVRQKQERLDAKHRQGEKKQRRRRDSDDE